MKIFNRGKKEREEIPSNIVADNDYLVSLVQLAMEKDDGFRDILSGLARRDKNERVVLLTMMIDDLKKNRVDPELTRALEFLRHDEVMEVVKKLLE